MLRCGFFVSSATVETASKPTYAKKIDAAAADIGRVRHAKPLPPDARCLHPCMALKMRQRFFESWIRGACTPKIASRRQHRLRYDTASALPHAVHRAEWRLLPLPCPALPCHSAALRQRRDAADLPKSFCRTRHTRWREGPPSVTGRTDEVA